MLIVHASELDRLELCPASFFEKEGHVDLLSDDSRFGSAGHRMLELTIERRAKLKDEEAVAVALAYGLGREDAEELLAKCDKILDTYVHEGARIETERRIEIEMVPGVKLTGRFDMLRIEATEYDDMLDEEVITEGTLVDHKFSKNPNSDAVESRAQMAGLAALLYSIYPSIKRLDVDIHFPMQGKISRMRLDPIGLNTARSRVSEILRIVQSNGADHRRNYGPGSACKYCPAAHVCAARHVRVAEIVSMGPMTAGVAMPIQVEQYPLIYEIASQIENRAEAIKDAIKADVDTNHPGGVHSDYGSIEYRTRFKKASVSAKAIFAELEARGHAELANELKAHFDGMPKRPERYINNKATAGAIEWQTPQLQPPTQTD